MLCPPVGVPSIFAVHEHLSVQPVPLITYYAQNTRGFEPVAHWTFWTLLVVKVAVVNCYRNRTTSWIKINGLNIWILFFYYDFRNGRPIIGLSMQSWEDCSLAVTYKKEQTNKRTNNLILQYLIPFRPKGNFGIPTTYCNAIVLVCPCLCPRVLFCFVCLFFLLLFFFFFFSPFFLSLSFLICFICVCVLFVCLPLSTFNSKLISKTQTKHYFELRKQTYHQTTWTTTTNLICLLCKPIRRRVVENTSRPLIVPGSRVVQSATYWLYIVIVLIVVQITMSVIKLFGNNRFWRQTTTANSVFALCHTVHQAKQCIDKRKRSKQ